MIYHMKLSLFIFLVLISTSIPISFIYLSGVLKYLGSHIILGIPCSGILLWRIGKKVPVELFPIVMPVGYVAFVLSAILSLLGFGRLLDGL